MKKKAFIVVGHAKWGKSSTLISLIGNSRSRGNFVIGGIEFFIRRMSNDDVLDDTMLEFVQNKLYKKGDHIILTFCPAFGQGRKSKNILEALSKDFNLYFFIIKFQFKGSGEISDIEIRILENFGKCELVDKKIDAESRSKRLEAFILKNIKGRT